MSLYDNNDYTYLNEQDKKVWEELKEKEVLNKEGKKRAFGRVSRYREYPKSVRHYLSIFPNNFVDAIELKKEENLLNIIKEFKDLIDSKSTNERDILNFINNGLSIHMIVSLVSDYNFGHHSLYVFPEFQLGVSYRVDYLIVGKNSGGYEFIFVELESCNGRITLQDGNFGEAIRKGINQVQDWKVWLEENYQSLYEIYNKYKKIKDNLPVEFMKYDSTRIHYAVVAGRRTDFNDVTYRQKRSIKNQNNINLIHYDNLIDLSRNLIGKNTY